MSPIGPYLPVREKHLKCRHAVFDTTITFGVEMSCASDGAEALQLTQRLKPDAVVLDVRMPILDGFDVLTAIRRNTDIGKVPVLMLTACKDETTSSADLGSAPTTTWSSPSIQWNWPPASRGCYQNTSQRYLKFSDHPG
jgi:CheY-like chemotaxis protein